MTKHPSTVRETQLDNGVRVVTDTMETVESVSLGAWFGVGTRHERPEINGVAHLLEHMAFKGTQRRTSVDIAEEIEAVGGHLNAYTSREVTAYFAKVLKEDAGLAIDILSDILINSTFEEEELTRERSVVLQEIGQAADTPDDIVFDLFQETAFPDQPVGRPVLGTAEIVTGMPRQSIVDFVSENYAGDGMVFSAAGNIEHEALVSAVEAGFLPLRADGMATSEPAAYVGGEHREERELEQVHLLLGLPGAGFHDEGFYAQQIFSTLFGGGMSSRLFQEVREKRGLAYSIYSFNASYRDGGLFGVYAGTGEQDLTELVPVVCGELTKVAGDITDQEIDRARAQLKSGLLMSREATSARCEQAAQQTLVYGRRIPVPELVERIEAVDRDAIRSVVEGLCSARPTVTAIGPLSQLEPYDTLAARFG